MKLNCNSCDRIYSSLDVRFTKACDNNCDFCIEKEGLDSLGKTDVNSLIESTLQSGIKSILIVGGEPLLDPVALLEYVEKIRDFVDQIYITTSLPKSYYNHKKEWEKIFDYVDGVNVSLQSVSWMENNAILNASHKHNRIGLLGLLLRNYSGKIRVNLNLTKTGLNSRIKVTKAIIRLHELGCKHVKLNELQDCPEEYVSFSKIFRKRLPSPYANGCQTEIRIRNVPYSIKITLKRSCLFVEESQRASIADLLKVLIKKIIPNSNKNKFMVLYENGKLSNNWLKK